MEADPRRTRYRKPHAASELSSPGSLNPEAHGPLRIRRLARVLRTCEFATLGSVGADRVVLHNGRENTAVRVRTALGKLLSIWNHRSCRDEQLLDTDLIAVRQSRGEHRPNERAEVISAGLTDRKECLEYLFVRSVEREGGAFANQPPSLVRSDYSLKVVCAK